MGALVVGDIFRSVRITLLDPAGPSVNWTDADLLGWFNEAERASCGLRPELFTKHGPIPMAVGTLQSLPADGTAVMRLDENVQGGARCRLVDAALLDTALRYWPAGKQQAEVIEWAQDPRDRKRFHVYPANDGTGSVVALYGAVPPPITATTKPINLDDIYEAPLKDFVLGMAYSANTKRQDIAKASFYLGRHEKALGLNAQSTVAVLPKYGNPGGA